MSKENKEEIFTFNLSLNDKNATDITVEIINLEEFWLSDHNLIALSLYI